MTDAPSPERVKRKALTRSQLAELVLAQMGKCAKCGERLNFAKKGQVVDEHLTPLAEGGTNETSNRALYCVGCARPKTAIEQRNRGKSKRIAEGRTQADKRARAKTEGRYRPIAGRGFSKDFKRRMDGTVERRVK